MDETVQKNGLFSGHDDKNVYFNDFLVLINRNFGLEMKNLCLCIRRDLVMQATILSALLEPTIVGTVCAL